MPQLRDYIKAGRAEIKADRVIRNGMLVNVASEEIYPADIAIYGERIVAVGDVTPYLGKDTEVIDAAGAYLCPGMIDGHLHVECSKMSITSFAKAVVPPGHHRHRFWPLTRSRGGRGRGRARIFFTKSTRRRKGRSEGVRARPGDPLDLSVSNVGHYLAP